MKKFLLTLLVLAVSVPAMAAIDFTVTDNGGGSVTISYVADAGPRGIALAIETDGTIGDATGENGDTSLIAPEFNCFMDFASEDPAGYTIGLGNPLAAPNAAGQPVYPASLFSVCMGVLDEGGNQAAGPIAANLVTLQLTGATKISVALDTFRGGVVEAMDVTGLPVIDMPLDPGGSSCKDRLTAAEQTAYDEYEAVGADPSIWCAQYQCRGDADGATQGFFKLRVFTEDLNVIIANWKAKIATADPAADINHLPQGFFKLRVFTDDLNIVIENWKKKDVDLDECPGYVAG